MVPQLNHFASKIHEGVRKVGLTKYVNWKLHKVDVFDCVHILNPTYHGLQLYLLISEIFQRMRAEIEKVVVA